MNSKNIYSVLVVDDSEDDKFFLRRAVERFPRFKILHELDDGTDAVAYLTGHDKYADRTIYPIPDLLLLDLKMPHMTGYEVLRWLKSQHFPAMTVIVLSGSILQQDVEASLALGAHGFWSKTASAEKQQIIATEIEELLNARLAERQHSLQIIAASAA